MSELVKGRLHRIEHDMGGNLGTAWTVEFSDWARFYRWMAAWSAS